MAGSKKPGSSRAPPLKKQSKSTTATKRPKNAAPSTSSKLLELPAELRNRIFEYALVGDEPVKVGVQRYSSRGRSRGCLTMLPGLINTSKQLRHETQLLSFKESNFEITPEVLKERSAAPLLLLRTMHRNMGLELSSVRVCQKIKKRCHGELFQLKARFTLSMSAGVLTISDQDYSAIYLGRSKRHPATPHIEVCGCDVTEFVGDRRRYVGGNDVVEFLLLLKKRFEHRVNIISCQTADLDRTNEVVYRGDYCRECLRQGKETIPF